MYTVTASIVTYHNPPGLLNQAIACFLNTSLNVKLFISDNSATDALRNELPADPRLEYRFNNANLGFGQAHNLILKEVVAISEFHVILNPDVVFDNPQLLAKLVAFAQTDRAIGAVMPKVVYPDGSTQLLAKLLPSPLDLITRRFLPFLANKNFDLAFTGYANTMDVPFISGCFMFLKTAVLNDVGLFDDRYFMYCEDLDLSRRINAIYRTVFYPEVEIVHHYAKGSYKNKNLLKIHLQSAFRYFNKWGWLIDPQRSKTNKITLEKITAGTPLTHRNP
jgi:GT2 family glycosyltransferase